MYVEEFTEVHDILDELAPTAANAAVGAHPGNWADMADYHRAFCWLHIGEPGQGATIDVAINQATDNAGAGSTPLLGLAAGLHVAAMTPAQIVVADSGNYIGIEIRSEMLDVSNGYHFIQVTVTVGADVYYYSMVLFGIVSRYEPVGVTDFQEIVTG